MSNANKILSPEEVAKQNTSNTGIDTIEEPKETNKIVTAVPIVEEIKTPVEKKAESIEKNNNVPPKNTTGKLKKFFILTWKMSSYSIFNIRVVKGTPLELTGKTKKAINYMVKEDIWKVIEK